MKRLMRKAYKWLSIIAIVFFIVASFPTAIFAQEMDINSEDETSQETSGEAEIDKLQQNSNDELDPIVQEDDIDIDAPKTTEKKVPTKKEKNLTASNQTNERAPPVTVDVRIELHDRTLVDKLTLDVEPFDIRDYITNYHGEGPVYADKAKAIHAIIRALETVENLDLKSDDFILDYGGNYIAEIAGHGEFTHGPLSGWLYFVNHEWVPVGVGEYEIKPNDSIVLYFVENYIDSTYTWFEKEAYEAKAGEPLTLKLNGSHETGTFSLEGISLLVDDEVYTANGNPVLFNEDGEVTVTFDKPGTYRLSATRTNSDGQINIVRPYALVHVSENEQPDKEPPVITVENIQDGQIVDEPELTFTVRATDNRDGNIRPVVLLNGEELSSESGTFTATLVNGENTITITAKDRAGNEAVEEITITYKKPITIEDIDEAIHRTANYILNHLGVRGEWQAIGLSRAGYEVPESYLDYFYNNVESQIVNQLESGRIKITDIERLALAALAINEDPTDINGLNLIDLIYNSPTRRGGYDTMTFQGHNGLAFALIALDAGNFEVPDDAKWTRDKIVAEILKGQHENGGWSLNAHFSSTSIDITAMVLTSLAPYTDQPEVQEAVERALQHLSEQQIESGGYSEDFVGGENSEASSQVIIALTSHGIDPTSEMFTKSQNLVEHLLSFQNEDGGFRHTNDFTRSDGMATEQALQALVAYKFFLEGKGPLYRFTKDDEPIDEEETEEPEEPIVDEEPEQPIDEEETEDSDDPNDEEEKTKEPEQPIDEEDGSKGEDDSDHHDEKETTKTIDMGKLDENDQLTITVNPEETIIFQNNEKNRQSKLVLPKNLPKGTKLTVNKLAGETLPLKDNFKVAGDFVDITLKFPDNKTYDEGGFVLTLAVDPNIKLDEANVYHFNPDTKRWELIPADEKDPKNHTITVTVDHFSIYAVLAQAPEETSGAENIGKQQQSNNQANGQSRQAGNNDVDETMSKDGASVDEAANMTDERATAAGDDQTYKLPNTATSFFNIMSFGLAFMILGATTFMIHRKFAK